MKIQKQNFSLPVNNYDCTIPANELFRKHGQLFGGNSKRCLIVGASGCGKTNVMLTLLEHPNGLRFENVYLYSKSLYQPKYEYLRKMLNPIKEIGFYEYHDDGNIISPENIKPNSIIIFDDIACSPQSIIRDYFCFGRHKNTDCFYLFHTYTSIPKRLIRDNEDLIIIFKQDNTYLKHIYVDHCSMDMSYDKFKDMCFDCWKEKYQFVVIDKASEINKGRYRKGFDAYISM